MSIRRMVPRTDLQEQLKTALQYQVVSTGKSSRLVPDQVFNLAGELYRAVPDISQRATLLNRLRNYVFSSRRGKLRLPRYLATQVPFLLDLRKSQVRERMFWVKPNTSIVQPFKKSLNDRISRAYPGIIWTGSYKGMNYAANTVGTVRLCKRDVPRVTRPLWPSTPTFSEMMAMGRKGIVSPSICRSSVAIKDCITRQRVSDDIRLATAIVADNIIGIRATEYIPEKFLNLFRRRWGFLILTTRYEIPAGLVRCLLAHWIASPFNLWLRDNCRFRNFLKRHTPSDFVREVMVSPSPDSESEEEPQEIGNLKRALFNEPLDSSLLEEMGEEFKQFFLRLPD